MSSSDAGTPEEGVWPMGPRLEPPTDENGLEDVNDDVGTVML